MFNLITIVTIIVTIVLTAIAPSATSGVTAATSDVTNVGGITRIEEVDIVDFTTVATSPSTDRSSELNYIAADAEHLSADKYRTMFKLPDAQFLANIIYNIVDDMGNAFKITKDLDHVLVIAGHGNNPVKCSYFNTVFDAAYYCGTTPEDTMFMVFIPEDYHLSREEIDIINEVNASCEIEGYAMRHTPIDIDTYYTLQSEHMLTAEREAELRKAWIDTPEYTPALLEDLEELSSLL